jgi:hypothetical protein
LQATVQGTSQLRTAKGMLQALHFACLLGSAAALASEIPAVGVIVSALGAAAVPLLELIGLIGVLMATMGTLLMLFASAERQMSAIWSNMEFTFRNFFLGTACSAFDTPSYASSLFCCRGHIEGVCPS